MIDVIEATDTDGDKCAIFTSHMVRLSKVTGMSGAIIHLTSGKIQVKEEMDVLIDRAEAEY